jgi:hypothetical protein
VIATCGHLEALTSRPLSGIRGLRKRKIMERSRDAVGGIALEQASEQSSAQKKGHGGNSAKGKTAQLLADASSDILARIKRSFAERRYSPSTSMDRSEREIILEQLFIMGLIVKEEVVSGTDD